MTGLDALRAFAHQAKQEWTLLVALLPWISLWRGGKCGTGGCVGARALLTAQDSVGCENVSPPLPSTPTAVSHLAGTGTLKRTPHSPNHRTDLSMPDPLPVISISSHPPSGLVAKSAAEPLESGLMKAFYSNRMKCQVDASSRGCCHD